MLDEFMAVTDEALARARHDPDFRQRLLSVNLELLLAKLHQLQRANAHINPALARQIREGATLAARLADLIRSLEQRRGAMTAAK